MRRFAVSTEGTDRLGLRELCDRAVHDLWVPTHLNDEQAAAFALEHFKRTVTQALEMLEVQPGAGLESSVVYH